MILPVARRLRKKIAEHQAFLHIKCLITLERRLYLTDPGYGRFFIPFSSGKLFKFGHGKYLNSVVREPIAICHPLSLPSPVLSYLLVPDAHDHSRAIC